MASRVKPSVKREWGDFEVEGCFGNATSLLNRLEGEGWHIFQIYFVGNTTKVAAWRPVLSTKSKGRVVRSWPPNTCFVWKDGPA